jgi:hypothetical protein
VIPLLGIYLKERKSGYSRDTCTPIFITTQFIIPSYGSNPDTLQLMNRSRKCKIYIYIYRERERESFIREFYNKNDTLWFEDK